MNKFSSKANDQRAIYQWRFYGVAAVSAIILGFLIWHLIQLQVLPNSERGFKFLQGQGLARTLRTETIPAYRGVITDRYGEPLAMSTPVVSLWANPQQLTVQPEKWQALADALGVKFSVLAEKINRYRKKEFMYLDRQLAPADAERVLQLSIGGIYGRQEFKRFYPAGEVTAHLVGFTNVDDKGQEGVELAYEQWLSGSVGRKQVLKDLSGRIIKDVAQLDSATAGKNISLSIDLRLQYLAYRELKASVKAHNAVSGSMVMLDAQTGEVLAMVNQPSFNPNDRSRLRPQAVRNRAMTDQFEPGSTVKPLTIMAALETGRYTPDTKIDTHPGYFRVGRKTLLDPVNYGVMDLTKIITKSSQVGLTKVSLDLEASDIRDLFFRVGLGQTTGTGFPGESVGILPNHSKWQPIVQANFSFGYGLALTALQLAQAYSVIADDGMKKPVSILKLDAAPSTKRVVDKKIANQVVQMLKTVVLPGGTAKRANVDNYVVAGKTGTIHKVGKGGYADNRYTSLFAGFAPADDPKIIAVVVVNEPSRGQYYGGEVAAPVFASVVERGLQLLQIPPDEIKIQQAQKKRAANAKKHSVKPSVVKVGSRLDKSTEPLT
ncbi:MAG: cell division protein FtsI (penicillin-binding protein 3) [Candidatus Endobugula sp.]|jgi:cell division protein FtsI (penicillin-binding protein 3)